jgi:beta-xylosidase
METVDDITKEGFISIVDGLERDFHSKLPGFIDSELLFDEKNNLWIMIQHWESAEQLKTASNKIFTESTAEPFIKSLNNKNIKMTIAPQIKTWR